MTPIAWTALAAFILTALGAGITLVVTRRAGLVDVPNDRSSHSIPTPNGGGIALTFAMLILGAYEAAALRPPAPRLLIVLAGALAALTVVGWLDDRNSLSVAVRLPVHLLCGVALAAYVAVVDPVPGPIQIAWLALWIVWSAGSINIVNFMDGIDGMVASQGVVYGFFLFGLLPTESFGSMIGVLLAGACLGFLVWNWAPAKMFLGDAGSGPLGLLFAIGGALALQGAPATLVFLPLFPLFLDALLTMIRRWRKGDNLAQAHRSHLYQRLANGGMGHGPVSALYGLAASVGALLAVRVRQSPAGDQAIAIVAYLAVVALTWKLSDMKRLRE